MSRFNNPKSSFRIREESLFLLMRVAHLYNGRYGDMLDEALARRIIDRALTFNAEYVTRQPGRVKYLR